MTRHPHLTLRQLAQEAASRGLYAALLQDGGRVIASREEVDELERTGRLSCLLFWAREKLRSIPAKEI